MTWMRCVKPVEGYLKEGAVYDAKPMTTDFAAGAFAVADGEFAAERFVPHKFEPGDAVSASHMPLHMIITSVHPNYVVCIDSNGVSGSLPIRIAVPVFGVPPRKTEPKKEPAQIWLVNRERDNTFLQVPWASKELAQSSAENEAKLNPGVKYFVSRVVGFALCSVSPVVYEEV